MDGKDENLRKGDAWKEKETSLIVHYDVPFSQGEKEGTQRYVPRSFSEP